MKSCSVFAVYSSTLLLVSLSGQVEGQALYQSSSKKNQQFMTSQVIKNTMDTQVVQTIKTFLKAVQQGDQPTMNALLDANIKWHQPGSNRFSGTKQSSTELFQMVGSMFGATANTLQLTDIKQVTVHGNQVACLIHWRGAQPGGGVLDVDNIDVYTVENGKIIEATIYSQDINQEDSFWGN